MRPADPVRAPTHGRTRTPRLRAVRRRRRAACRIAPPPPGRSRPRSTPGGGPPAPRNPASAQDSAQRPEAPRLETNPLHVHHHVGESGMHEGVSQDVHVGEWVHARRSAAARPRGGELLQGARAEGAQKQQPARAQCAQALGQRIIDRVEPGHRHARHDEVHAVRRERQPLGIAGDMAMSREPAGARALARRSRTGTGSTHSTSASRKRRATRRATAPVPAPRSRMRRGAMRMPSRRSSRASCASRMTRSNAGSPSPARANCRRTATRSNVGGIERRTGGRSAMADEYGDASPVRREPTADACRDESEPRTAGAGSIMGTRSTGTGGIRCNSCAATSACSAMRRAGPRSISATRVRASCRHCATRAGSAERARSPARDFAPPARFGGHRSIAPSARWRTRRRSTISSGD